MKHRLIIALTTVIIALALAQLVVYARGQYIDRSNHQILSDIVNNTVGRTERSIDQTLSNIGDLYAAGKISCGSGSSSVFENLTLRSTKIKGVVFSADGATCASSRFFGDADIKPQDDAGVLFATNRNISFHALKRDDLSGLVLNWQLDATTRVSAFLNTEGLAFDVLPAAVRDTSNLEIILSDGTMLGFLRMDPVGAEYDVKLSATSPRFPIRVKLNMPQTTFDSWNNQFPLVSMIFGFLGLLGASFLIARGIFQSGDNGKSVLKALKNGSIIPYYQPVYCIASGDLIGFEVLARRKGPGGKMLSPATFIPTIEKNGWDDKLLEVLVKDAAKNMESLFDGVSHCTLAFNVTPNQIAHENFVPWFVALLQNVNMPSDSIILEVTEREVISNLEVLQRNISALRDYEITIAIDDVGTGHNGLSSIHQLRADYLKIDKLFVDGVVMDKQAGSLVKMLAQIGAQYGMQIIAEGVETEEQLNALRDLGVDEVQGFYLAKPMPALEAIGELAHHRAVRTRVILADGLKKARKNTAA